MIRRLCIWLCSLLRKPKPKHAIELNILFQYDQLCDQMAYHESENYESDMEPFYVLLGRLERVIEERYGY